MFKVQFFVSALRRITDKWFLELLCLLIIVQKLHAWSWTDVSIS